MDGPETSDAVRARALAKRYGEVVALDGVDLCVPRGSCFGLLGPNGAGKTTLVSILTTLLRPGAGEATILGHDVVGERAAVRREIGIVFQESTLDLALSAREHLALQARLYHLPEPDARAASALEHAGLAGDADRPVRGFSGGMRRRLEIARGLLHEPRVLFLDEPTLGLDVASRAEVWQRVGALRAQRETTVFLTTHSMQEADALCETLAILDRGRIVAEGAPAELKASLGGDLVELTLRRTGGAERLRSQAGVRSAQEWTLPEHGVRLHVTTAEGPRRLPALLDALRDLGVEEVTLHRPSLEDVFLHHTGHPFEPDPAGDAGGGAAAAAPGRGAP